MVTAVGLRSSVGGMEPLQFRAVTVRLFLLGLSVVDSMSNTLKI